MINGSGDFQSLRAQTLAKLDPKTQFREMVRLGAAPDVVVGSAHAITEDGQIVVASASGSQLGPYSAGAGRVFLLVGAQKVVPDLETAMRRLETYAFPLEDVRAHGAYGRGSAIAKILIIRREMSPERITVVLIREAIGF
ncbi:MAG: lactate utilization protein [Thermoplasmata archaeon]|nr:lactate utilization protein [Thermoplasmata archaeon]